MAGYDGGRSIDHEDVMLSRREGLTKSVAFLKSVAPSEASEYAPQSSDAPQGAAAGSGHAPFAGAAAGPGLAPRKANPCDQFRKICAARPRRPEARQIGAN